MYLVIDRLDFSLCQDEAFDQEAAYRGTQRHIALSRWLTSEELETLRAIVGELLEEIGLVDFYGTVEGRLTLYGVTVWQRLMQQLMAFTPAGGGHNDPAEPAPGAILKDNGAP